MKKKEIIQQAIDDIIMPKANESALIISSPKKDSLFVAYACYESLALICKEVNLIIQPARTFDKPMSNLVYKAMESAPDIIIQTDVDGLGHDPVGKVHPYTSEPIQSSNILYFLKATKQIRAYWFAVNNLDHFFLSLRADLSDMRKRTEYVATLLHHATRAVISTGNRYSLRIDLHGMKERVGISSIDEHTGQKGSGGNLPLGEVYATPVPHQAYGEILIDSCYYNEWEEKTIFLSHPLLLTFDGVLQKVAGEKKEREAFLTFLSESKRQTDAIYDSKQIDKDLYDQYSGNIGNIGELGIGLNPLCRHEDDLLFAEKVLGSCHIALGRSYHGDVCVVHADMVTTKPTLSLRSVTGEATTLLQSGVFIDKK